MFTAQIVPDDTRGEMLITLYKTDTQGRIHYYSLDDRQGHLFSKHSFTVNWGTALVAGLWLAVRAGL